MDAKPWTDLEAPIFTRGPSGVGLSPDELSAKSADALMVSGGITAEGIDRDGLAAEREQGIFETARTSPNLRILRWLTAPLLTCGSSSLMTKPSSMSREDGLPPIWLTRLFVQVGLFREIICRIFLRISTRTNALGLAEVLARFDLGEGGLVPFTIYQADLVTPLEGPYFLLNFGARKDSLLPELCEDAQKWITLKDSGRQLWRIKYLNENAEVVVDSTALSGADPWFEGGTHNKIFLSDALASVIIGIGLGEDFRLIPCRVVEAQP
ncbi:hypothetical protein ACQKOE_13175 [Novosphingobium sp. NPDC080210]|uniref:hypothetical protein n=1 Tax=Novosphingobium sp. NPDC080210 TaxID=3390596 RepID=UPI003D06F168